MNHFVFYMGEKVPVEIVGQVMFNDTTIVRDRDGKEYEIHDTELFKE